MKKSRVLLTAAAFVLLAAPSVLAGESPYNPQGASSGISAMPGMGLSYPTIQAPTAAQPGAAVPYSAQKTLGEEVPAAAAQAPGNNSQNVSTSTVKSATGTENQPTKSEKPIIEPPIVVQQYDDNGEPYTDRYHKEHLPRMAMVMLRRPEFKPSQFILRLIPREGMTTCVKYSKIPSTIDFKEGAIEITLEDYTIDSRNLTLAPHYKCNLHPKNPTADVILDRDDLTAKSIKFLKLKVGQVTDTFDVDINQQRIRLKPNKMMQRTPPRFKTFALSNIRAPLTHWFYPEGTVILYVPDAKGQNVTDQVITMAKSKGLEPINDAWPDFRSPLVNQDQWYFIDKKGAVAKSPDIIQGTVAGTVQITQTIYGLEKDEQQTKDIPVFARAPNSYE